MSKKAKRKKREAETELSATKAALSKIRCPKCGHSAIDHTEAILNFMNMFMYNVNNVSSASVRCVAKNEVTGGDKFVRLKPCNCDLSPSEVRLNAERQNAPKTVDDVIGSILP